PPGGDCMLPTLRKILLPSLILAGTACRDSIAPSSPRVQRVHPATASEAVTGTVGPFAFQVSSATNASSAGASSTIKTFGYNTQTPGWNASEMTITSDAAVTCANPNLEAGDISVTRTVTDTKHDLKEHVVPVHWQLCDTQIAGSYAYTINVATDHYIKWT